MFDSLLVLLMIGETWAARRGEIDSACNVVPALNTCFKGLPRITTGGTFLDPRSLNWAAFVQGTLEVLSQLAVATQNLTAATISNFHGSCAT